jgi:hypothetical protein
MTESKINITTNAKAKAEKVLLVIGAARLGTSAAWNKVEDEAAKISRLAERSWLKNKSEMDFDEYTIMFILHNYKKLCDPSFKDDYIVGDDSAEESEDTREYRLAL